MAKASRWAVYCSPDRFCVVLPAPLPGHRKLSPFFAEKTDALKWRGRKCKLFPPNPTNKPQDFICP